MGQLLLVLVVALVVGGIVFGVAVLITGTDRGLGEVEPDGQALPMPTDRPLVEGDVARVRFDTTLRGYRMAQVDQALRRAAYDIGYKDELISVLEAEIVALRAGRMEDAEVLRRAREAALVGAAGAPGAAMAADAELTLAGDEATTAASDDSTPEPVDSTAESDEPVAGPDEPVAGPDEPVAGPDESEQAEIEPEQADSDADLGADPAATNAETAVVDARSGRP